VTVWEPKGAIGGYPGAPGCLCE